MSDVLDRPLRAWRSCVSGTVTVPRRRGAPPPSSIGDSQAKIKDTVAYHQEGRCQGPGGLLILFKTCALSSRLPRSHTPHPKHSCSMPDEFTLKVPFLAGLVVVVSLFVSQYLRRDPMVRSSPSLLTPSLNSVTLSQLDSIPTIGFSDPILSYFSAIRYIFDSVRMISDGYETVIFVFLICFLY